MDTEGTRKKKQNAARLRMAMLTAEQRSDIAKHAANARWSQERADRERRWQEIEVWLANAQRTLADLRRIYRKPK